MFPQSSQFASLPSPSWWVCLLLVLSVLISVIPGFILCNHAFVYIGCPMNLSVVFISIPFISHYFTISLSLSFSLLSDPSLSVCLSVCLQQHRHSWITADINAAAAAAACAAVSGAVLISFSPLCRLVAVFDHIIRLVITVTVVSVVISPGRSHQQLVVVVMKLVILLFEYLDTQLAH